MRQASMAAGTTRTLYRRDEVIAILDQDGDEELDDCFFPGSDDELGFEEEIAMDERYIIYTVYSIQAVLPSTILLMATTFLLVIVRERIAVMFPMLPLTHLMTTLYLKMLGV